MNIPTLDKFEKAHQEGRVSRNEHNGYVLFKYKSEVQYGNDWDDVTLNARGIIFDLETKKLVALPFKKFFNLNETKCNLSAFPNDPNYEILEKMDGSMGCIFLDKDKDLKVATPGSFTSDQAIWATNWIKSYHKYNIIREKILNQEINVIVAEIICPLSKVVVPYDFEGLVVISAQDGKGYLSYENLSSLSDEIGLPICKKFSFESIEDIKEYLSGVEDFEGFVLHWPNTGFRIKIKGEDYLFKHRILSSIHPNRIDEAIESSNNNEKDIFQSINDVVKKFPEEYSEPYKNSISELLCELKNVKEKISEIVFQFKEGTPKELAMWLKSSDEAFHKSYFGHIMNAYRGRMNCKKIIETIWKEVRNNNFSIEED